MQQCHLKDVTKHDRSNGRIYRISYNDAKPVKVDLQKLSSDEELVKSTDARQRMVSTACAVGILQERAPVSLRDRFCEERSIL